MIKLSIITFKKTKNVYKLKYCYYCHCCLKANLLLTPNKFFKLLLPLCLIKGYTVLIRKKIRKTNKANIDEGEWVLAHEIFCEKFQVSTCGKLCSIKEKVRSTC